MKLNSAKIQGFRGINEPREVEFGPNITILCGQNGQGKTSILQSIEWAITGELPEFHSITKEDAIVNSYTQRSNAVVSLMLNDSKDNLGIKRVRKKSTSSRKTKTNTSVELEKNGQSIPNPELALQNFVGISNDNSKNYYIKQDSIRAIINEKPEEQSRGIEQVLGTAEIRQFIDALNKKTSFTKIKKQLGDVINSLESASSDQESNFMEEAEEKKEQLLKSNFTKSELTIEDVQKKTEQYTSQLKKVSEKITDDVPEFSIGVSLDELEEFLIDLKQMISDVDKQRQENSETKTKEKIIIGETIIKFQSIEKTLSKFGDIDLSKQKETLKQIQTEHESINNNIAKITLDEEELFSLNQSIQKEIVQFKIFDNQLNKQKEKDPKKLESQLLNTKNEEKTLDKKIEKNTEILENSEDVIEDLYEIIESLKSIKQGDISELEKNISKLKEEIITLSDKQGEYTIKNEKFSTQITELISKKAELKNIRAENEIITHRIEKSIKMYGDEKQHEDKILENQIKENECDIEIKTFGEYNVLLEHSIAYIKNNKNDSCPVCEQSVKSSQLISSLNEKIQKDISKKIDKLKIKKDKISENLIKIQNNLDELESDSVTLTDNKKEFVTWLKDISKITENQATESVNVDVLIEEIKKLQIKTNSALAVVNKDLPIKTTKQDTLETILEQKLDINKKIEQIFSKYSLSKNKKSLVGMKELLKQFKETKKDTATSTTSIQKQISALDTKTTIIQAQKEFLEEILVNLEKSKNSLNEFLDKNYEIKTVLEASTKSITNKTKQIENLKTTKTKQNAKIITLVKDKTSLSENIITIESLRHDILDLESNLQKVIDSSNTGNALLKEVKSFKKQLENDLDELSTDGSITLEINKIIKNVTKLIDGPLDLLSLQKRAKDKQQEETTIKQKIQTLETRRTRIQILENSLKNIQSATNEFLSENTSDLIETHRQQIEQIYNKIVRHPSFEHIKLEIKSTDPLVYSIMVYDDEIGLTTQAATRLSSAQMNSFAMSVLITNNLSQTTNLSLLMMDDPTQSMDSQHKDALAKLILEISDTRQIIIATSDDEFLKCLQNTDKDIKNIELKDWSRQGISFA